MEIFNDVDRKNGDKKGPITSTYPAWYFRDHIDKLEEDVAGMERMIENGMVPKEHIPTHRQEIEEKTKRLEAIRNSKPELSSKDKDRLARLLKEFGDEIRDKMPTYTDMQKGLASPQDEVRVCHKEGVISAEGHKQLLNDMGIKPMKNNKLTRNQAAKAYKIAANLLGEPTNIERLRRDRVGHSYKSEPSLDQLMREG